MAVNDYLSMYSGQQMDDADTEVFNPDATPTEGSDNLVTSGGVFSAIGAVTENSAPAILNTASGAVASFPDGSASPMTSVVAEIVASQAGSGDPAPDNIRPISGFTGANVTRAGRNLAEANTFSGHNNLSGTLKAHVPAGQEIIISGIFNRDGTSTKKAAILLIYADGTTSGYFRFTCNSGTREASSGPWSTPKEVVAIGYYSNEDGWSASQNFTLTVTDFQIELGSTAHDYEPYAGDVFSVSWQDAAGTVYGGTVDLVSGVLTVTHAKVTFDGSQEVGLSNWQPNASSVGWLYAPNKTPNILNEVLTDLNIDNIACDTLKVIKYGGSSGLFGGTIPCVSCVGSSAWGIGMRMNDPSLTTNASINAWLSANPVTVVYRLASPQTYQLTPQEVASLLGANTLWNDVNGDTSAEYRADTKLYIQSLLGA